MISGQVPVRQKHVHDTWAVRDLPVLDATIGLLEHSYMVTVSDIAAKTSLDPSVVAQALDALNPVYVDFRKTTTGGDPRFWYVFKVTPEARRAVGQWPSAEALVSRLVEELSAAARREGDAENQGLLAYAARLIGDTLRDATLRAAAAVLAPAFGGLPVPEMGQQVPPPPLPPDIEFDSLVPLPELPELLRPQHRDDTGQPGPVTAQPEPARSAPGAVAREEFAREEFAPEPPAPEPPAPEPTEGAAPEPIAPQPTAAAFAPEESGWDAFAAASRVPEPPASAELAPEPPAQAVLAPEPTEESASEELAPEAHAPEQSAPEVLAPEPPAMQWAMPEPAVPQPAVPQPAVPEPAVPELAQEEPAEPEPAGRQQSEPTREKAAPREPSTDVPDLNPWPERPVVADKPSAALNGEPLPEATPFRSSLGTWPAADGDADAADTAQDLVQLRRDAV